MSTGNEEIEGKLAAYVDGELDAAGRVEIEKHLLVNPQHRQLLVQLGKLREMTRALPRASAPPDVMEALGGQLERSALLDDIDAESDALAMRINRWPQIRALAAVLVLSLGLAGAVYLLLPSPKSSSEQALLMRVPDSAAPGLNELAIADGDGNGRTDLTKDKEAIPPAPSASAAPASTPLASVQSPLDESIGGHPGGGGGGGRGGADFGIAPGNRDALAAAQPAVVAGIPPTLTNASMPQEQALASAADLRLLNGSPANGPFQAGNATEYVVVSTEQPAAAEFRMTAYLRDNGIAWQPMVVASSAADAGAFNIATTQQEVLSNETAQGRKEPTPKMDPVQQGYTGQLQYGRRQMSEAQNLSAQPIDRRISSQQVYVARNMTRRQANELKSSLEHYRAASSVNFSVNPIEKQVINKGGALTIAESKHEGEVTGSPRAEPVATTLPAAVARDTENLGDVAANDAMRPADQPAKLLGAGDTVAVEVRGINGLAADRRHQLKVGEDGMLEVPLVGQVLAGGLTSAQVESSIGNRLRESNFAQGAQVHVSAADGKDSEISATTMPAASATTAPFTMPSEADAAAKAERVDVVIVLENYGVSLSQPATLPSSATQPAEPPALLSPATLPTMPSPVDAQP